MGYDRYRIVGLSVFIKNGDGFREPARNTYLYHRTRANLSSEQHGIDLELIGGKDTTTEEFSFLNCHIGTYLDAPWHPGDGSEGKRAITIDEARYSKIWKLIDKGLEDLRLDTKRLSWC